MNDNKPKGIEQFPLQENTARKIINDLAENYTGRIFFSPHAKERMSERGVTTSQILRMLQNKHAVFTEGPYETPSGDWKFNLRGKVAGDTFTIVVALKNHQKDPKAALVTVWVE